MEKTIWCLHIITDCARKWSEGEANVRLGDKQFTHLTYLSCPTLHTTPYDLTLKQVFNSFLPGQLHRYGGHPHVLLPITAGRSSYPHEANSHVQPGQDGTRNPKEMACLSE